MDPEYNSKDIFLAKRSITSPKQDDYEANEALIGPALHLHSQYSKSDSLSYFLPDDKVDNILFESERDSMIFHRLQDAKNKYEADPTLANKRYLENLRGKLILNLGL